MEFSRDTRLAIAASLAILVVPPFLTPFAPFHDSLAVIGLQSYPPRLSYGPTHYYVFQLTYILHHLISRLCMDIGIGAAGQSRLYYLIHALGYFAVTVGLLTRFVAHERLRAVTILLGALAFMDGMFVLGGPIPFSIAGVLLMLSVLAISEASETERLPNRALLAALALMGMLCHPFAAPFFLALYAVNFLVTRRQRALSAAIFLGVAAYSVLISRDSPESVSSGQLWQLFDPNLPHLWHNFVEATGFDANYIRLTLGDPLPLVSAYANAIAALKLLGALLSVIYFQRLWSRPRLRLLLALNLAFLAMFATGVDVQNGWILAQWPWRVWSVTNPLMYSFAIIAAVELGSTLKLPKLEIRANWALPAMAVLVVLLATVQYQIFAKGRMIQSTLDHLKATVAASGIHNALVSWNGAKNINPYFLRSVPYLMFSDPDMIARNLIFVADWHTGGRHNTHIPELNFPSPRPRLTMEFLPSQGTINAVIHGMELPAHYPMTVRFGARIPATGAGEPILTTGKPGDANIVFVLSPSPGQAVLYLDAWGSPWTASPPFAIDPKREYKLDVWLGGHRIKAQLDGVTVWERDTPVGSLENPVYGRNPVGGTMASATFSGTVTPAP
ncbi:MAG: hypothetical protein ABI759_19680 [Candidatus Solibacter sp.]